MHQQTPTYNYYPFGLRHKGYNNLQTGTQGGKYKYNGKELDEDLGLNLYHYGFRLYGPVLGRFPSIDPKADAFPHVSTYNYAENTPINSIDLWGLQKKRMIRPSGESSRSNTATIAPSEVSIKGKPNSLSNKVRINGTIVAGVTTQLYASSVKYGRCRRYCS